MSVDFTKFFFFSFLFVPKLNEPFNVSKYAEIADFPDPSDNEDDVSTMSCAVVAKMPMAPFYYYKTVKAKYGPKACQKALEYVVLHTVQRRFTH